MKFDSPAFLVFSYLVIGGTGISMLFDLYRKKWIARARRLVTGTLLIVCASTMSSAVAMLKIFGMGTLDAPQSALWLAIVSSLIFMSQFAFPFFLGGVGAGLVLNSINVDKPTLPSSPED